MCNMQTELGKQNKVEQLLASGYLTRPTQIVRPSTASHLSHSCNPPSKSHQVVGQLNDYEKTRFSER